MPKSPPIARRSGRIAQLQESQPVKTVKPSTTRGRGKAARGQAASGQADTQPNTQSSSPTSPPHKSDGSDDANTPDQADKLSDTGSSELSDMDICDPNDSLGFPEHKTSRQHEEQLDDEGEIAKAEVVKDADGGQEADGDRGKDGGEEADRPEEMNAGDDINMDDGVGVSGGDQETCRRDDESTETGCETIKESRAEIRMGKRRETVPALHQERAGESHTGTSDEASLMRELATNANVVRFLADIRKATSPTASEMEKTQLVTLLCDSGLGQLGGNDQLGQKRRAWLASQGVLLASAQMSPEVLSQLGLITEQEKIQMSRISQAKQGYSELEKEIIRLQQQWDEVECECDRDRETKAFLLEAASRFKGLLELVAPGFSAKLKKDADKN